MPALFTVGTRKAVAGIRLVSCTVACAALVAIPVTFAGQLQSGDTYYTIVAKHSGKCLAVGGASKGHGANVLQWRRLNSDEQKWRLVSAGSHFTIIAKHSCCPRVKVSRKASPMPGSGSRKNSMTKRMTP